MGDEIQEGILNFVIGDKILSAYGGELAPDVEYRKSNVWPIEAQLLTSGIAGVRLADPDAKIVLYAQGLGEVKDNYEFMCVIWGCLLRSQTRRPFWACILFPAWSNTTDCSESMTSLVIS